MSNPVRSPGCNELVSRAWREEATENVGRRLALSWCCQRLEQNETATHSEADETVGQRQMAKRATVEVTEPSHVAWAANVALSHLRES